MRSNGKLAISNVKANPLRQPAQAGFVGEKKMGRNTANKPTCDSCGELMKLQKAGHVKVEHGRKCRLRRFKCELCDIVKTIYAN